MNVFQTAKLFKAENPDIELTRGELLSWASQCQREAVEFAQRQDDLKREAFRARRMEEIKAERYLERLRSKPIMRDHGNWDARESSGNPFSVVKPRRDLANEDMHAA